MLTKKRGNKMFYEMAEAVSDAFATGYEALADILPTDTPTLTAVSLLTAFVVCVGSLAFWG